MGKTSVLNAFRQSGSFKCLFPRTDGDALDAVLLNTAGGITGGDVFKFQGHATEGTALTLTSQACERAYQAKPGPPGQISNLLKVDAGARLTWLPQETILFEGSALDRHLNIDLTSGASVLMAESWVFGRAAMGEVLTDIRLRDRIEIRRNGKPIFLDAMQFNGDLNTHLIRPNIANGAGAMALVVYVSSAAEGQLDAIRKMLPETAAGATLLKNDMLVVRILTPNSFELRRALIPILRQLNNDTLPRCWMI
ncbi:MAG: urease accessory protein UreD [Pseudomonadota bacterium]